MYLTFFTKEHTIRDIARNEYHSSTLNHSKVLKLEFVEEHNGEVVYRVELACGVTLLAFSDEIIGGK